MQLLNIPTQLHQSVGLDIYIYIYILIIYMVMNIFAIILLFYMLLYLNLPRVLPPCAHLIRAWDPRSLELPRIFVLQTKIRLNA